METFHLSHGDSPSSRRFCICRRPAANVRGGVLYLHPFAEEMNKSRRMAALQARALAEAGWIVLALDLHGCGDSDGDFSDASWSSWLADARLGLQWLRGQTRGQVWAWGLRAGCLLASAMTHGSDAPDHVLMWQPPSSGKSHLQQFLRLRAALEGLEGGAKGVSESLRRELAAGRSVEVAGYALPPALARGLESATLEPAVGSGRACFIEIAAAGTSAELTPAMAGTIDRWRAAGWTVDAVTCAGPAFWQTTEIEVAPAWISATCSLIASAGQDSV